MWKQSYGCFEVIFILSYNKHFRYNKLLHEQQSLLALDHRNITENSKLQKTTSASIWTSHSGWSTRNNRRVTNYQHKFPQKATIS